MDSEEQEEFLKYDNISKQLLEYFSNPNIDLSQLADMLKLYDKYFYNMNKTLLIDSKYDIVIDRFKEVGENLTKVLSIIDKQTNQTIGHMLLQQALEQDVKISKRPSLLQYFFYEQCKKNNIPYNQPMQSFFDIRKGANTTPNNIVQIGIGLGNKQKDVLDKNIFVLFAILHEMEHIKHKLANPNGNNEEQLFNLLSRIQPLEDGFYNGAPSNRIGKHSEFPDEIFADIGACKALLDELQANYNLSTESLQKIKEFLKELSSKLLIANNKEEDYIPTSIEYLEKFIQKRMVDRFDILSPTEQERVKIFLQDYSNIQNLGLI